MQKNKNINPNDIIIDLNDERISQMKLDNKDDNGIISSIISGQKK